MKKRKKPQPARTNTMKEETPLLKELLHKDVLKKLQQTQSELISKEKEEQEKKKQAELKAKREREKNKTFEELFGESSLDWKKFK